MAYKASKPRLLGPDLTMVTRELVKGRTQTYEEIAQGTGLSYHTVVSFARNNTTPSARNTQAIYEFLSGKKLIA